MGSAKPVEFASSNVPCPDAKKSPRIGSSAPGGSFRKLAMRRKQRARPGEILSMGSTVSVGAADHPCGCCCWWWWRGAARLASGCHRCRRWCVQGRADEADPRFSLRQAAIHDGIP